MADESTARDARAPTTPEERGAAAGRDAPFPPLHRNRDFLILWSSQAVSTLGTRVSGIAYPLLALALTRSPFQAGLVGFAQTLPFLLLYLPAGALVDRWRRRVMLACELGRAVALGSVGVAAAAGVVGIAQLVVVAFVEGSLLVFFDLCEGAALPHLVSAEQLPSAIAQNQARLQGADLAGQPLGGFLFAASRAAPFLFDAATYGLSLLALTRIRAAFEDRRETGARGRTLRDDIAEGIAFVWAQPFLRTCAAMTAGMNFAFTGLTLALIVRATELGASSATIGLMFACFGAGALLGALAAPTIHRRLAARPLLLGIAWLWTVEFGLMAVLPSIPLLGLAAAVGAFGGPAFNVVLNNGMYRVTPDRLIGRARSAVKLVAWGSIPFGSLAAGVLAGALHGSGALVALAGVMLLVALAATAAPGMREMP